MTYAAKRKDPIGSWRKDFSRNKALYIMILLPLTILIIFKYVPMYGVVIAFENYKINKGVFGSEWVGLKNFLDFFSTYHFGRIMTNTILINLYSLATFPLAMILALLINYIPSRWFKKTIQTVSYAPYFISTVVMCGMILQFLSVRGGLINALLGLVGISPINFMGIPEMFYSIYVWTGVWQGIGYDSIIFIATLAAVSPGLHESAVIDGASIPQRIWHVDIPGVLPTFLILLILRCGQLLTVGFEKILLLQNALNISASSVISTYVYSVGLSAGSAFIGSSSSAVPRYSYATAVDLFTAVINMILLFTVNRAVKTLSDSDASLW